MTASFEALSAAADAMFSRYNESERKRDIFGEEADRPGVERRLHLDLLRIRRRYSRRARLQWRAWQRIEDARLVAPLARDIELSEAQGTATPQGFAPTTRPADSVRRLPRER